MLRENASTSGPDIGFGKIFDFFNFSIFLPSKIDQKQIVKMLI